MTYNVFSGTLNPAHFTSHLQQDAAEQVQRVLVEDHQLFPVLFGGDHRVQDQRVGRRSDDANKHDGRFEVVSDTT